MITQFLRKAVAPLLGIALLFTVLPAKADELSSAKASINTLSKSAIAIISDKSLGEAQTKAKFGGLLRSNFNTKTIGKFALGRYWRQATPAQQTEYLGLFEKMVVNVYTQRFFEYSGQTVAVVGGRKDDKSGDILVNTKINQTDGSQPVPVDWRMRDGKIIDVIVSGVSMSVTQRDDFASVIQQGGGKIDALLTYMRGKSY